MVIKVFHMVSYYFIHLYHLIKTVETFVSFHCRPLSKTVKYNTLKVSKSARSKKAFSKF